MARDSHEESSSKLINSWILDNAYYTVLKEFVDRGEITFSRDMVQGTVNLEKKDDSSTESKVYLLLMMCKLIDGADPNVEYYSEDEMSEGSSLTALEDTLDIFGNVEELCIIDTKEVELLKNMIRRQAVFVCCAENNFALAKTIYNRCWKDAKIKKSGYIMKTQVEMVLRSGDREHELMKEYTYEKFLKVCRDVLNKIHEGNFSTPYLKKLADEERAKKTEKLSVDACTQTLLAPEYTNRFIGGSLFRELVEESRLPKLAGRPFRLPEKLHRSWIMKLQSRGAVKRELRTTADVSDHESQTTIGTEMSESGDGHHQIISPSKYVSPKRSEWENRSPKRAEVIRRSPNKYISPKRPEVPRESPTKITSPRRSEIARESPTKLTSPKRVVSPMKTVSHRQEDVYEFDDENPPELISPKRVAELKEAEREARRESSHVTHSKKRRHQDESSDEELNSRSKSSRVGRIDASSPTVSSSTPEKAWIRGYRFRRNEGRADRYLEGKESDNESQSRTEKDSSDEATDEYEDDAPLREKKSPSKSRTRFPNKQKKHGRLAWSPDEEEKFYQAVQDRGVGNWADILYMYNFTGRTNVNLKDKWRQFHRSGLILKLQKKFGPI